MKQILLALLAAIVLAARPAFPAATSDNSWVEVNSPHFVVLSDATVSQAQNAAMRFERVRAVFKKAFPAMRVYPNIPIIVLAARDEATFQKLEPARWLEQGQLSRVGMLLRNPDRNYILLRLDAPGANPYHVIYHEYAHLVLEDDFKAIPLWLNEGLAEFYGNSEIDGKKVRLGLPSPQNLKLLQSASLLPLTTLFTINQASPYYNEEGKGNIFYAQSWALTDYLMFQDLRSRRGPIDHYLTLVAQGGNPVKSAGEAFGNLQQLQNTLVTFVHGLQFHYYGLKVSLDVREKDLHATKLSPAASAGMRGSFLVRVGRFQEAEVLLKEALGQNPQLASADESMGLAELGEGRPQAAQVWFAKAADLSSHCYLARFYQAQAMLKNGAAPDQLQQIRKDFNDFIQFNRAFAPAYAALATVDAGSSGNLGEARQLAAEAGQLDPHHVQYFFLESEILLKSGDFNGAVQVAHKAIAAAQSAKDKSLAYVFLGTLQEKVQALGK